MQHQHSSHHHRHWAPSGAPPTANGAPPHMAHYGAPSYAAHSGDGIFRRPHSPSDNVNMRKEPGKTNSNAAAYAAMDQPSTAWGNHMPTKGPPGYFAPHSAQPPPAPQAAHYYNSHYSPPPPNHSQWGHHSAYPPPQHGSAPPHIHTGPPPPPWDTHAHSQHVPISLAHDPHTSKHDNAYIAHPAQMHSAPQELPPGYTHHGVPPMHIHETSRPQYNAPDLKRKAPSTPGPPPTHPNHMPPHHQYHHALPPASASSNVQQPHYPPPSMTYHSTPHHELRSSHSTSSRGGNGHTPHSGGEVTSPGGTFYDDDRGRGSYKCGRCGVPKKGHVCPYQPKVKRRPEEPLPEMKCVSTQVEMDEFMTLRRLNIEIQGFPESYASEPMDMVGSEVHLYSSAMTVPLMGSGAPSYAPVGIGSNYHPIHTSQGVAAFSQGPLSTTSHGPPTSLPSLASMNSHTHSTSYPPPQLHESYSQYDTTLSQPSTSHTITHSVAPLEPSIHKTESEETTMTSNELPAKMNEENISSIPPAIMDSVLDISPPEMTQPVTETPISNERSIDYVTVTNNESPTEQPDSIDIDATTHTQNADLSDNSEECATSMGSNVERFSSPPPVESLDTRATATDGNVSPETNKVSLPIANELSQEDTESGQSTKLTSDENETITNDVMEQQSAVIEGNKRRKL